MSEPITSATGWTRRINAHPRGPIHKGKPQQPAPDSSTAYRAKSESGSGDGKSSCPHSRARTSHSRREFPLAPDEYARRRHSRVQQFQRLFRDAMLSGRCPEHQRAVCNRLGKVWEYPRAPEYMRATNSGNRLAERRLIGIDQPKVVEPEICNRPRRGPDVQRIACFDENNCRLLRDVTSITRASRHPPRIR